MEGVITIRELLAGTGDLHVEAVGTSIDHLSRIADRLRGIGLEIVRSDVLKSRHTRPFDRFGEGVDESEE